jgi:hypothetical protein
MMNVVMLNVIMLSVTILSNNLLNVIMLSVTMLSINLLIVFMLSVTMLSKNLLSAVMPLLGVIMLLVVMSNAVALFKNSNKNTLNERMTKKNSTHLKRFQMKTEHERL